MDGWMASEVLTDLRPSVQETWDDYKNLRLLELSKHRWPEAKV